MTDDIKNTPQKQFVVAALYKFASLDNYEEMRIPLQTFCVDNGVSGTLLLASEGINGTVAGPRESIDLLLQRLRSDERLKDLDHKESYAEEQPFHRMKVKLKKEIVTLGIPEVNPTEVVGNYVAPKEWNALISDPEVILIDTRNQYEVDIGTFEHAVDPHVDSFREFPAFCDKILKEENKEKKIAMFCTGGIRCEKSTSFLKQRGFENVYHLKGGILKYLEEVPKEESMWNGECYVFDGRVAVDHNLDKGSYDMCFGCRMPINAEDKKSEKFLDGVHCSHCYDRMQADPVALKSAMERNKQILLAQKRNETHLGSDSQSGKAKKAKIECQ